MQTRLCAPVTLLSSRGTQSTPQGRAWGDGGVWQPLSHMETEAAMWGLVCESAWGRSGGRVCGGPSLLLAPSRVVHQALLLILCLGILLTF